MNAMQQIYDRQVAAWLILCAAVVFGMIILGGVTRLTNSGLSIVEWKPLMGVIPPLSEQAWQETFDKYRQYPEYQKINRGMSVEAFKYIFMYEYLHRLLGRLIGVLFFVPMVYFMVRKRLRAGWTPKLMILFVLGGLQGLLGWYMVKSGLVDNPRVSQYRLTAHLGVAVVLYLYMIWLSFELLFTRDWSADIGHQRRGRGSLMLVALVFLMVLSGGLVAGLDAGLAYPTWPLMGDSFVPPGLYSSTPAWLSMFEDITTVQFNHRIFAYTLFIVLNGYALYVLFSGAHPRERLAAIMLMVVLCLQVVLGISTLLLHVPVAVASAHQGGAILLLTATLFLCHVRIQQ